MMQVKKHGTFQVGMWTEREREKGVCFEALYPKCPAFFC